MEQMRGVEPPSPPWQGEVLAVEPHLQLLHIIILENLKKINYFLLKTIKNIV